VLLNLTHPIIRAAKPTAGALAISTSLPRQPTRQNLHVIAHSLGAQAIILASVYAPSIFSSLTVIDLATNAAGKINDATVKLLKEVLCLGFLERYRDYASV
jgi:hypothetical protein